MIFLFQFNNAFDFPTFILRFKNKISHKAEASFYAIRVRCFVASFELCNVGVHGRVFNLFLNKSIFNCCISKASSSVIFHSRVSDIYSSSCRFFSPRYSCQNRFCPIPVFALNLGVYRKLSGSPIRCVSISCTMFRFTISLLRPPLWRSMRKRCILMFTQFSVRPSALAISGVNHACSMLADKIFILLCPWLVRFLGCHFRGYFFVQ